MYSITSNVSKTPISLISSALQEISDQMAEAKIDAVSIYSRTLVIVDPRARDRDCLAQSIISRNVEMEVLAFGSIEDWKREKHLYPPLAAILLNVGGKSFADPAIGETVKKLSSEFEKAPVIVLSDTDELPQILKAMEHGARGYIPSSVGIEVCIEAINLALAGGTFVPASSVLSMRQVLESGVSASRAKPGMFTERESQVVEALRKGKANKIIAYELQLCESTVKVHVRKIMKKTKATNRTEVAYKINELFPAGYSN